jgi:hypothetical protein
MASLSELETELSEKKTALRSIQSGVQSYKSGPFQLQRMDPDGLRRDIRDLEHRIAIVKHNGRVPGAGVVFGGHLG